MHPYLEHAGPIAFAHRGGASDVPENTIEAFHDAVQLGYRYLETDVHATKDGVLVAFHDADLQRTCGVNARINDLTVSDLQKVRVHGKHHIPLMAELLQTFPEANFNIDCKSDAAVLPLVSLIKQSESINRVCVGSFSDKRLNVLREEFGHSLCTSMGPRQVAHLVVASRLPSQLAKSLRGVIAQVPVSQYGIKIVSPKVVQRAQELQIPIHVWTIDEPSQMHQLLDMGINGIMSDRTRVLKEVFIQRGIW